MVRWARFRRVTGQALCCDPKDGAREASDLLPVALPAVYNPLPGPKQKAPAVVSLLSNGEGLLSRGDRI